MIKGKNETRLPRDTSGLKNIKMNCPFSCSVGYWSLRKVTLDDQNIGTPETAALLCVTEFRLSISTRDEAGIYMSQLSFDIRKMETSQRYTEYSKGEVRLQITFINDDRCKRSKYFIKFIVVIIIVIIVG